MPERQTEEKRIKQQLVKYGRRIARAGFVIGPGGNISIRNKNLVFLKARNVNMSEAGEDDYIAIDLETGKLRGRLCQSSSEYRMHIFCYQERPDIRAVIHTHPVFTVVLSPKIKALKSRDYEFLVNAGGQIRVIPYIQPGTHKLAQAVSKVIKQDNAVILKNHGLVCVGRSLEQAYVCSQAIERVSLIYILRTQFRDGSP